MGTAVLHPQDCLPPSQSHPNCRFPIARSFPASYDAGRDSCVGRSSRSRTVENRGILGSRDSSAGLLPLPDRDPQIPYSSAHRSAVQSSPYSSKRCRSPASTYGSTMHTQRCSLPSLDLRKQPACNNFGSAALAHPPIAPIAKTQFLNSDPLLKWSEQHKVKSLSEAYQPVSHFGRSGVAKQLLNHVADMQTQSACRISSKALARRQGKQRQLNQSPSGRTGQEREGSNLAMPYNQQAARKLVKSLSNISASAHSQKGRGDQIHDILPPVMKNEREIPPSQGALCARRCRENMKSLPFPLAGTARLSLSPWSHNVNDTKEVSGIVNQEIPYKMMAFKKSERVHQRAPFDFCHKDSAAGGHVNTLPHVLDSGAAVSSTTNSNWHFRAEDVMRCIDSANDTHSWLSMVDERWAGPSFFNSPPPSSLPVPRFTFKLSRTTSTSPGAVHDEASLFLNVPFPKGEPVQDIATKDLRRLLHLDHASCDA